MALRVNAREPHFCQVGGKRGSPGHARPDLPFREAAARLPLTWLRVRRKRPQESTVRWLAQRTGAVSLVNRVGQACYVCRWQLYQALLVGRFEHQVGFTG